MNLAPEPSNRAPRTLAPLIFLLSPANVGGARGRLLLSGRTKVPLAARLRTSPGAEIGEVFSFMSGLYFRGKLAYARTFARPPRTREGTPRAAVLVITAGTGLQPADIRITIDHLRSFAGVDLRPDNEAYRAPLVASAEELRSLIGPRAEVVLLGSIATAKYVDVLVEIFGERLRFPAAFVGRGDMSRGRLLLRAVEERRELEYVSVLGAVRHGPRPARLAPRSVG